MTEPQPVSAASREELIASYEKGFDLRGLCLRDGKYDSVQIQKSRLDAMDLSRTVFQDVNLSGASLVGAIAKRAIFTNANLSDANLSKADFRDADLNFANLTRADVRGCTFTPDTNLRGATVTRLKIDRRALRMLGAIHGGLTDADLAEIDIHDDQIRVATAFGGIWGLFHLVAVSVFLLPYIGFLISRYVAAQMRQCEFPNCVSLREAFWMFIVTGGKGEETDWIGIVIFGLLLFYSVFRVSLVFKSNKLSLIESASGIPRQFVLSGYWWIAYHGSRVLVWVNLCLILIHAYILLETPVHR